MSEAGVKIDGREHQNPESSLMRTKITSNEPSVPDTEVRETAINFWHKFSEVIGLPEGREIVREIAIYEPIPKTSWYKFYNLLMFPHSNPEGGSLNYEPILRRINIKASSVVPEFMGFFLAEGLGEASVRAICGQNLMRPHPVFLEAVKRAAKDLYRVWKDGKTLDEYRQTQAGDRDMWNYIVWPATTTRENRESFARMLGDSGFFATKKEFEKGRPFGSSPVDYEGGYYGKEAFKRDEDWSRIDNEHKYSYLVIYLLATKPKESFHKFLQSTDIRASSNNIAKRLEEIYGTKANLLLRECANWWFGQREK